MWLEHPLAARTLASLRSRDFARYRDERLRQVGANSVGLELAVISHLFTIARKARGLAVHNLIRSMHVPKLPNGRQRRLVDDEQVQLLAACR
jgi:hypothetical protein